MAGIGALDALALACETVGAAKAESGITAVPSSPKQPATVSDSSADETDCSPVPNSDPSCGSKRSQARGTTSRGTEVRPSASSRAPISAKSKESQEKAHESGMKGLVVVDPARLPCPPPPVFAPPAIASNINGIGTPGGSSVDEEDTSSVRRVGVEAHKADAPMPAPSQTSGSGSSDGSLVTNEEVSHNDVLCGRGGLTNNHPGNVFFRRMVRTMQEVYLRATKRDKAGVAKHIVDSIRHLQPPGRFLKKHPSDPTLWIEIDSKRAREKTSQALRERAPELREELQAGGVTNSAANSNATADSAVTPNVPRSSPSPTEASGPARCRVVSSDNVSVPVEAATTTDTEPIPSEAARQAMASGAVAASAMHPGGHYHGGAGATLPFFPVAPPHALPIEDRNMHLVAPVPQHFTMHGPFGQAPQHHGPRTHHNPFPDMVSATAGRSSPSAQAQLFRLMSETRGSIAPMSASGPVGSTSEMGSFDSQHALGKALLPMVGTKRIRTDDCPPHEQLKFAHQHHSSKKSRSASSMDDAADADDEGSQSSTIKVTNEASSTPKKMKAGGPRLRRLKERMQES